MDEETLANMLCVGPVYVDVGYDGFSGTPTARTDDSIFGVMELGGEITTELIQYPYDSTCDDGELDTDDRPDGPP